MSVNAFTSLLTEHGLQERGLLSLGVLFFIGALTFIPRTATCIVGGLVFGLAAFPVALIGSTLGAVTGFLLSRYAFRSLFWAMARKRPRLQLIVDAIDAEGWRLLGLLRLASPVPGTVSNYLFGLTSMQVVPYTAATLFGSAPQVLAFVYLGAAGRVALDAHSVSTAKLVFTVAGGALSVAAVWIITRRVKSLVAIRIARQAKLGA